MGERFNLPKGFPSPEQLEQETLNALKKNGGEASNLEIKEYIARVLNLTDEILSFENSDGLTLLIDYRLRWARTALKNRGKIENPERGRWRIL